MITERSAVLSFKLVMVDFACHRSQHARAVQIKYRRTRLPFPSPVCYGPYPTSHEVLVSSLVSFFTLGTSCLVWKASLSGPFKRVEFQQTRFHLTTD